MGNYFVMTVCLFLFLIVTPIALAEAIQSGISNKVTGEFAVVSLVWGFAGTATVLWGIVAYKDKF